MIGHGQSQTITAEFSRDWPWPIIKTCPFSFSASFPARKALMDLSPQIVRARIGKANRSSEPIGIVGLYYVLSDAYYVLEFSVFFNLNNTILF